MIAIMFSGQGSQKVGMCEDIFSQENTDNILKNANSKYDLKKICLNGPDNILNQTKYAQPAIALVSHILYLELLKETNIVPTYALGLSLGEYNALCASKVLDLEDMIKILEVRGELMQNSLSKDTSMEAIIGANTNDIKRIIKKTKYVVEIANYNCPGQIILTGENKGFDEINDELKSVSLRVLKLNVSGAFHSSLLESASIELKKELDKYSFNKPIYKIVYNCLGTESYLGIKDLLKKQIKSSVYFNQSIEYLIEKGVDTFIQIGPGQSLCSFVKKINKNVKVYSIDSLEAIKKFRKEYNG